jgi:hypothetical protein
MIVADHVTLTVRVDARRVCCRYRAAQSRQLASVAQPSAERSPLSHIGIRAKISWAMIALIDQTTYLNVISSGRRPRSNTQGVANTTARIRAAYYDSTMLKMVLGNSITEDHFDDRP